MVATPTPGLTGNSYATVAEADTYLENSVRAATNWDSLDEDSKSRALITATDLLDRQTWVGTRTNDAPTQTRAWPRTGVQDCEGLAVDSSAVPEGIVNATIELAYELSQDASVETSKGTGSNVKSAKAGSAQVVFFRPGDSDGSGGPGDPFPFSVMGLVRCFLGGSLGVGFSGPTATGTGQGSSFDACDGDLTGGYA